jgi:hypothetical protein
MSGSERQHWYHVRGQSSDRQRRLRNRLCNCKHSEQHYREPPSVTLNLDAETGSVIAGTLGGWSCDAANPPTRFAGSFAIERLPLNHSYNIYAEPW